VHFVSPLVLNIHNIPCIIDTLVLASFVREKNGRLFAMLWLGWVYRDCQRKPPD